MRVLVAEDNPIPQKILASHLATEGFEVVTTNDGEEAWQRYNAEPFRIVVSDWLMPGLDGVQLCEQIRNRPDTPYTYFIMLTANGEMFLATSPRL